MDGTSFLNSEFGIRNSELIGFLGCCRRTVPLFQCEIDWIWRCCRWDGGRRAESSRPTKCSCIFASSKNSEEQSVTINALCTTPKTHPPFKVLAELLTRSDPSETRESREAAPLWSPSQRRTPLASSRNKSYILLIYISKNVNSEKSPLTNGNFCDII